MTEAMKQVKDLIARASSTHDSGDAMKLAQAALNAANALCSLVHVEKETQGRN